MPYKTVTDEFKNSLGQWVRKGEIFINLNYHQPKISVVRKFDGVGLHEESGEYSSYWGRIFYVAILNYTASPNEDNRNDFNPHIYKGYCKIENNILTIRPEEAVKYGIDARLMPKVLDVVQKALNNEYDKPKKIKNG